MSYDMKKMSRARKEIKDVEFNGKMVSIEWIERKALSVEKKRAKLMKDARKVLNFNEMCEYIDGKRKFRDDLVLPKMPDEIEIEKLVKG